MTTTYSDPQVAIECRLALGDTPDEIARRLRVPIERVWAVGERMDELAKHKDDPCDRHVPKCSRGHALTPDNIVPRTDDRVCCLQCKRDRDKKRRPRRKGRAA